MWKWFMSWFCKHEWVHVCNVYGDPIIHLDCRSIFKCVKCEKRDYRQYLVRDWIDEDNSCDSTK